MFSPTAQNGSHSSDSYTVGEFHTRPARNAGESASVGEVGKGIKAFVKFLSCIFSFPPFFPFRFVSVSFFFITSSIATVEGSSLDLFQARSRFSFFLL